MNDFLRQLNKEKAEASHQTSVMPLQRPRCSVSPINNQTANESFSSHDESSQQATSLFQHPFLIPQLSQLDNQSPPQMSRVVSFANQLQSTNTSVISSPFASHLQPMQMSIYSPNINSFVKGAPIQSTPNKYFTPSKPNVKQNKQSKVNFHSINDLAKSSVSDSMHESSLSMNQFLQIPSSTTKAQQSAFQSFANLNESSVNQTRDSGFASINAADSSIAEKLKAISMTLQNKENCQFIDFVSIFLVEIKTFNELLFNSLIYFYLRII
jgi:hypothetical protein